MGLRKEEEEEELRVLPRALAEALWAPTTSVRPAFQASWTSLLAPSQRTLTLGFSPKSGPATWLGRGDVPNGQRSRGSLARGPKPSLLTLTQQRPGGAARHSTFASWCERHSATRMAWMIIRGGSGWREERCEGDTPVSIWRAAGTTCMDRVSERCTLWAKFTRCFFEYRWHAGSRPQTRSNSGLISSRSGAIPLGARTPIVQSPFLPTKN